MSSRRERDLDPADVRHHSEKGYSAGCRLQCCKDAHTAYNRLMKIARIARGIPDHAHGTANGYNNYNCRCTPCQVATVGR